MRPLTAPFPYFGGKRRAAETIWAAIGDPGGYVEPFAGSAAVLLGRPAHTGRRTETLNDADGWLVNTWRAIQLAPDQVAAFAAGPVTEIDYHARLAWLQARRDDGLVAWLEGDPEAHDPKAAAWWLYVMACGIGNPFDAGPWIVKDRHLVRGGAGRGIRRELPHLGSAGQGIKRELPHLGDEALREYMRTLSQRLKKVRITCGDWRRVTTPSVTRAGTGGDGSRAVFLDPPYATSGDLYTETTEGISDTVREWCMQAPRDHRIVLAGYDDEHAPLEPAGWVKIQGKSGSGSGYSTREDNGRREKLWLSPACNITGQGELFGRRT